MPGLPSSPHWYWSYEKYFDGEMGHLTGLDPGSGKLRSFRMAFSNHEVNALLETLLTYDNLAENWSVKGTFIDPTDLFMENNMDNCASAVAKIYDAHALEVKNNPDLKRYLQFPQTTFLLSPRNWAKYAVGSDGELLQGGDEWLQNRGWVVASYGDRFSNEVFGD